MSTSSPGVLAIHHLIHERQQVAPPFKFKHLINCEQILINATDESRTLNYRQLRYNVRHLIFGLQSVGIRPGDCVCVQSFNDIQYAILYLGIIGAGAIFLGLNPSYTTHEILYHFKLCKPKVAFVQTDLLDRFLEARNRHDEWVSTYHYDPNPREKRVPFWETLLDRGEADWVKVKSPQTTVCHYASTSGTSGFPKAAMLTHSYHVTQAKMQLPDPKLPYKVGLLSIQLGQS